MYTDLGLKFSSLWKWRGASSNITEIFFYFSPVRYQIVVNWWPKWNETFKKIFSFFFWKQKKI